MVPKVLDFWLGRSNLKNKLPFKYYTVEKRDVQWFIFLLFQVLGLSLPGLLKHDKSLFISSGC